MEVYNLEIFGDYGVFVLQVFGQHDLDLGIMVGGLLSGAMVACYDRKRGTARRTAPMATLYLNA
jgi:hypothetical protein